VNKFFSKWILALCIVFSAYGDDRPSPKVKELVSPRGIKFWFMNDGSAPLIHIKIAFKNAGASHQEKGKTGIPIFFSNVVFCGSGEYSKTQFAEECSNLSIAISSKADLDYLYFSLTAPKIVLGKAVALLNVSLTSPNFEEDKVKLIQNGIGGSMQNYAANPTDLAFSAIIPSIIFKSHDYENGIFGLPEDFMKLSIDDLKDYKSKFLTVSNAEICIFGDISENEAISLIDGIFSKIKNGEPATDDIKDIEPQLNSQTKKYYADGPQSSIFFVLKTERPTSDKRFAAAILYRILGEGLVFKGRILSKLRTEKGLIYSGNAYSVDLKHSSYIFGELHTDNSKVQEAINLLKSIIKDLREKGITESELQFAKNNINGKLLVSLRTSEDLCRFYFHKKLQGFGTNALSETIEKINQVTLTEVNSLAAKILDKDEFVVIGGGKE
jgi:zinc protease